MKQYGGKKEGEPEELTHLTEGSFEDTTIIACFYFFFSFRYKNDALYTRLDCSSSTSYVRFYMSTHFF